jgi:hypothetical protein
LREGAAGVGREAVAEALVVFERLADAEDY